MDCLICYISLNNSRKVYRCIRCQNWWCDKCQKNLKTYSQGAFKLYKCPFCRKEYYAKSKILPAPQMEESKNCMTMCCIN